MARGIEEDAEGVGRRLMLVLHGSEGEHGALSLVEIGDGEVQVHLLGMILAGPLRRLEILDLLERDGGSALGRQLHPLGVVLVRRRLGPAREGRLEPCERARIGAVDGAELEARDRHHASGIASGPDLAWGK